MPIILESTPLSVSQIVRLRKHPLGEVRVRVRLTNSHDAIRLELGEIRKDAVRQYEADALVDTGAVMTVIPSHVAEVLGVGSRGKRVATYADGREDIVDMTNPLFVEVMGRDTVEECLVLGDEVLIGQTVLEKTDLFVDCARCRLVPNPAHPDQPVLKVKGFSR